MKSTYRKLSLKSGISLLLLGMLTVDTSNASSGDTVVLPGHERKTEQLAPSVSATVIGKFISLGYGGTDEPGTAFFEQAKVAVINSLEGSLSGTITASYSVRSFPVAEKESAPITGIRYIMFIETLGPNEHEIRKLLAATDENIALVKTIISTPKQAR
jgi:hypothetical protein